MKCINRSITLLASLGLLATAADTCALVDGAKIRAADLAILAPAFAALPPDKELAPAPAGTMVRVFYKSQLAALLPGLQVDLPDRLCVQRKRDVIPPEAWQAAVDAAMTSLCATTPWRTKVLEAPQHRFPTGEVLFNRSGIVASRGSVQLWRGALMLPDKSSIPVWVRVELQARRRATILQHAVVAGAILTAEDYKQDEIWAPGPCTGDKELPNPDGLVAKRAIAAGAELVKEDLRRPPAIHRGQSVELEAASGATRIRVPAVAEQDGEVGETVQLRSGWNGSRLTGRVTGAQKARVE